MTKSVPLQILHCLRNTDMQYQDLKLKLFIDFVLVWQVFLHTYFTMQANTFFPQINNASASK